MKNYTPTTWNYFLKDFEEELWNEKDLKWIELIFVINNMFELTKCNSN